MWEVRAGDVGKLEQLYDRHHRPLFHFFLHLTASRTAAEDLVQEVFYRILKYRHTYQPETSFRAWLFQVGSNAHLDYAGRHKGEVALPEEVVQIRGPELPPDRQAQKKMRFSTVTTLRAAWKWWKRTTSSPSTGVREATET